MIGHVQIAGVPERHEPDVGEVNYPYLFELMDRLGYTGWVGCEYFPAGRRGSAGPTATASRPETRPWPPVASGSESLAGEGRRPPTIRRMAHSRCNLRPWPPPRRPLYSAQP